ncbi:hypothetical protein SCA6_011297 [Theobroma cacao]
MQVGVIIGLLVFKSRNSLVTMSEDSVQVLGTVASLGYIFFLFLSPKFYCNEYYLGPNEIHQGLVSQQECSIVYIGLNRIIKTLSLRAK